MGIGLPFTEKLQTSFLLFLVPHPVISGHWSDETKDEVIPMNVYKSYAMLTSVLNAIPNDLKVSAYTFLLRMQLANAPSIFYYIATQSRPLFLIDFPTIFLT